MNDVEYNPISGTASLKNQQYRNKLQEERKNDMKEFLASQAAQSHPRLQRILKSKELPPVSITEAITKLQYKAKAEKWSPIVNPTPPSEPKPQPRPNHESMLSGMYNQPVSTNHMQPPMQYGGYGYPYIPQPWRNPVSMMI